jgi:hypothetical protein
MTTDGGWRYNRTASLFFFGFSSHFSVTRMRHFAHRRRFSDQLPWETHESGYLHAKIVEMRFVFHAGKTLF